MNSFITTILISIWLLIFIGKNEIECISSIVTYNVTLDFDGGQPICTNCTENKSNEKETLRTTMESFACSSKISDIDDMGDWENGTKIFMDPMQNEHKHHGDFVLTQVTLNIFGLFDCKGIGNDSSVNFSVYLQDQLLFTKQNDPRNCECMNCVEFMSFSTQEIDTGFPNFSYGDFNALRFEVSESMICLSMVEVLLTYSNVDPQTSSNQTTFKTFLLIFIVIFASLLILIASIVAFRFLLRSYRRRGYSPIGSPEVSDPKQSFPISGKEIVLGPRIGKGSYGEVYRAKWRGIDVAVKKMPFSLLQNKEFLADFQKEAYLMASLRHPNVLQFLGSCLVDNDICILTEYMEKGSLYRLLHDEEMIIPFVLVRKFSVDVAKGMVYLHNSNPVILHRDLKSHNLLVDENFKVKISDFGLSKVMDPQQKTMTSCGTAAWAAPEILKNSRYTEKADVYSYAVCLWEFFTRQDPYEGMPVFQIIFAVGSEGLRPTVPENCPSDYSSLIQECWQTDPKSRPTFEQILLRLSEMDSGPEQLGTPAFLNSRHARTEDVQHRSDVMEQAGNGDVTPIKSNPRKKFQQRRNQDCKT